MKTIILHGNEAKSTFLEVASLGSEDLQMQIKILLDMTII